MIPAFIWMAALAGCLPVEGERVTAKDLEPLNPALAALSADAAFGLAPAPGVRRVFRAADLKRLAARHGLELATAVETCVERPMGALDRQKILVAMRASLGLPEARIELVDLAAFPVPRGEVEFSPTGLRRPPTARPDTPVLWNGSVLYGTGRRYPIWAKVRISVPLARVIAVEDLRATQPIQTGQVRLETAETFPPTVLMASSLEEVVGWTPRRAIPAGAAIPKSILTPAREVERGDAVLVEATSGRASVALPGRALSGGALGDRVKVMNPASGRSFLARVSGRGTVKADEPAGGSTWGSRPD